jgi:hypothetical protein
MQHATEVHRCLMTADVAGLLRIRAQTQPHLAGLAPAEALIALHMARVEARFMPHKLRQYSAVFLAERGYRRVEGRWITDPQPSGEVISAAGIASRSADPRVSRRIVQAMGDAYLDAVAGGIDAPEVQKERMLRARARERFRMRIG